MPLARADLESLLRTRRLDRTLTTALDAPAPHDPATIAATGVTRLDAHLHGGFPRGQLSEVVGPRSSGRASLAHRLMAAATGRGELVALVDALDMFDVESAHAAGVDLRRVLWIRGLVVTNPGLCRDLNQRAIEQAIRACALVLQAGNFGLVVFDAAEAPLDVLRRLPFTTWLRLQRMVEGTQTACVLVGADGAQFRRPDAARRAQGWLGPEGTGAIRIAALRGRRRRGASRSRARVRQAGRSADCAADGLP
jgi:hypothetical protein